MSEGGGFFDADDVVFEAEVGVDVFFVLEVAGDDAGAVFEGEDAAIRREFVGEGAEEASAEVFEVFHVGFANLAEEEAFQAGDTLAIVGTHLGEEPVGFAAATGAAVTDGGGAVGEVTETGRGGGEELALLQDDIGAEEVVHLITGTAGGVAEGEVALEWSHVTGVEG